MRVQAIANDEQNGSENLPISLSPPNIMSPDENVAEFMRITDALFGEGYCYVSDKSDKELRHERMLEKQG